MIDHEIIVDRHRAAIRPSTQFKRPLVGAHPSQPGHFTLNGLGTKGALQGPWAAAQLVACVLDGTMPDEEIHIQRWWT
jgi:glycine/D-amino acid oxidase-like deaminating enzyme